MSNNVLPIITKPTRLTDHTATLIDHIYTNSLQNFTAGILTVDITDHLPIFCLIEIQPPRNKHKRYFRDYSKFKNELFLDDINLIDWQEILKPDKDLDEQVQDVISALNQLVEKHAPTKKACQTKQKQLNKPWLTKAPFRLGARSRFSGTGTSLNRAFCRCPSKNLGTVPGHGHYLQR